MRRFLLTAATAATALVGTACSDVTGIGDSVAGSYELIRVNGQSLPADDISGELTFYTGVLELNRDGEFVDLIQYRVPGDPRIYDSQVFGTWERSGNDIRLEYDDSGFVAFAERPSSSRLIVEDEFGNRLEYRRF
ncbi:MAG: hypothetical protein ABR499_09590 [Gemmatimonadaceae bacterium]